MSGKNENEEAEIVLEFEAHKDGEIFRRVYDKMKSVGRLDARGVRMLFYKIYMDRENSPEIRDDKYLSMPYVQQIVRSMNEILLKYNKGVKKVTCENSGISYFMFLNFGDAAVEAFKENHSVDEVESFEVIVDDMIRKYDNFALPLAEAKMKTQRAELVDTMLDQAYFADYSMADNGGEKGITLGPRAMFEFETLLRAKYGEYIKECGICKKHLLQGVRCKDCKFLAHVYCSGKCECERPLNKAFLPPRYRETDNMIETQGPDVGISDYETSNNPSDSYDEYSRKQLFDA